VVNASNQLLEALGSSLNGLPMRRVELGPKQQLVDVGEEVQSVYFPINAIISIIAPLATGESLEVAMIGRDGGIGVGEALNGRTSHSQWIVQHPGTAITCHASAFRHIALGDAKLFSAILHNEQQKFAEVQQSAICVAAHQVEARFARWLLRARDLAKSDEFHFTQEYLAEMLAVRRTSVSPVAAQFQAEGLIRYSRGDIKILNVDGLKATACECYETVKQTRQHLSD
jgi:CRP-like cAMP-binding protein